MKNVLITLSIFHLLVNAQTNTTIASGETGNTLLSTLRSNYTPSSTLGYNNARDTLYKVIDKQADDSLECIYSGFSILLDLNEDPSSDADDKGINCEHAWPQSKGASAEPQKSNMHHLFPCKASINSSRGNDPFADIIDSNTDIWYKRSLALTSIPGSNINDYSEKENDFDIQTFEPREAVKGDIARAMFYFYAFYETIANDADANFWPQMKDDLLDWHYDDPVTAAEQTRSNAIAGYQDEEYNPFCFDSTLARRAWFSSSTSLAVANEAFYPYCTSIENSNSNPSNWSASGFSVSSTALNNETYSYRASAGTDNDFIYSPSFDLGDVTSGNGKMVFWARTTSSAYNDFGEVSVYADLGDDGAYETEVQTYSDNTSFTSGSYAKLTITLPDAILGQDNVRFRFAFKRATGNGGNWNFDDFSIINTASSVLFINEIDYNDPSTDDEEFVELCGLAGDYNNVTIKLINGSNGSVYGTVELGYITISNETEGYGFFVWAPTSTNTTNVDASTNGSGASSIQNGNPDGVQVDIDGVILDAVSYEDSGNSMNDSDGNAMEHTNLSGSSEDDASTTIGRQGIDGSTWELQTRTIGAVNSLADGSSQGYGQVITGSTDHFRIMSSPVEGQIYSDLLAELWTQGMTGLAGLPLPRQIKFLPPAHFTKQWLTIQAA